MPIVHVATSKGVHAYPDDGSDGSIHAVGFGDIVGAQVLDLGERCHEAPAAFAVRFFKRVRGSR